MAAADDTCMGGERKRAARAHAAIQLRLPGVRRMGSAAADANAGTAWATKSLRKPAQAPEAVTGLGDLDAGRQEFDGLLDGLLRCCGVVLEAVVGPLHDLQLVRADALRKLVRVGDGDDLVVAAVNGQYLWPAVSP